MYRIRSTGQVTTQGEIRKLHPNTSLPKVWNDDICELLGVDPVFEGPQATPTSPYQYSMQKGVEQINGKWYTKYVLGPVFTDYRDDDGVLHSIEEQETAYKATKDAEQAKSVREQRNKLLSDCDWTQVADAPVDKAAWATYRQALRDVSAQDGFPWNVTWPDAPTS